MVIDALWPDTEQDTEQDVEAGVFEDLEPRYKVFIHNDDVTPMDFVVLVLQKIFELNSLEAEHVMLTAHITGMAYVTTLPLTEAQKRVGKAHFAASLEGYPLMFTIEPE
ncbi:MAG TPA: ATP-dependent Clp protease adaptor ClpS [Anaerolineae bacterium]